MEREEFIKQLGINKVGHTEDKKYIIDLDGSAEYAKLYTLLDTSNLVDLEEYNNLISFNLSLITYSNEEFKVQLMANFTEDVYKIVIIDNNKKEGDNNE